jgi:hypothetical protein
MYFRSSWKNASCDDEGGEMENTRNSKERRLSAARR